MGLALYLSIVVVGISAVVYGTYDGYHLLQHRSLSHRSVVTLTVVAGFLLFLGLWLPYLPFGIARLLMRTVRGASPVN